MLGGLEHAEAQRHRVHERPEQLRVDVAVLVGALFDDQFELVKDLDLHHALALQLQLVSLLNALL